MDAEVAGFHVGLADEVAAEEVAGADAGAV